MTRSGVKQPQIKPGDVRLQRPDPVRSGPGCDVGWLRPAPERTNADTVWEDTTPDQATAVVLSAVSGSYPGIQLEWPDDAGLAGAIAWLIESAHGYGRDEAQSDPRTPDTSHKPATELLPPDVLLQVASLLGDSAGAHAQRDFADGRPWSVDYAALQRHLLAFWSGENADPASGRSHAIHIAARGLLLAAAVLRHPGHDDRPRLIRPPTGPPPR